jgi:type II secretory pathway pseudopilin PulG
MIRRGVTLLELLLAIALLLALGALVLPALFDRLAQRAYESSAEIVRSQLLLARAHAQATGEPIEVLFETAAARVAARRFVPGLVAPEPLVADQEQSPESLGVPEPWARRDLADGVWITDRGDDPADELPDEPAAPDTDEIPRSIRLALFMPNGSAVLAEPVWIRDDHGRRGRLTVNLWTGLPSFEPRAAISQEEEEPQDLPEVEPEPQPDQEEES